MCRLSLLASRRQAAMRVDGTIGFGEPTMTTMKRESFPIADIYVPVKRRATLKPELVQEIAASMLDVGQQTPIMVRQEDSGRLVLVEGLHRLEACRSLGDTTILGYLVQARKH
jgi:uncharacterized ParB-like nuclease family protein